MRIAVLAASGNTGGHLTRQAIDRGHTVTALARDPALLSLPATDRLRIVTADVHDPTSIARALEGVDVVLSGLGNSAGEAPGTLTAGARAVLAAHPPRLIWLGALGTGASAAAAGLLTRRLLAVVLRAELPDKTGADTLVLDAGGTVVHAGPLTDGPLSTTRRTVPLEHLPRRLLPAPISRATVAATMLDEAESGARPGQVLIPSTARR